jgi:adenosylcobinamide-GDP ribazoletransferase
MMRALRAPVAAIAFLTRVPVGRRFTVGSADVAAGAPLFPVVGGAVGLLCGLGADALAGPLPALVAGGLAVGVAALLTGAMHLDALADTADALGGGTPERALEIMRDHAIGAYGAVALGVVCLVDAAAIAALAEQGKAAIVALGAAAVGRAAMLPQAFLLPYARAGAGQGRVLASLGLPGVVLGMGLGAVLVLPSGAAGLAGLAAACAVAIVLGLFYRRWVGGVTGDLLGATAKLTETAFLVAALAALD